MYLFLNLLSIVQSCLCTVSAVMSEQALVPVPSSSCQGSGHLTALHQAAMVGKSDVIAALIQGGCAVDLQDRVSGGHKSTKENLFMCV